MAPDLEGIDRLRKGVVSSRAFQIPPQRARTDTVATYQNISRLKWPHSRVCGRVIHLKILLRFWCSYEALVTA